MPSRCTRPSGRVRIETRTGPTCTWADGSSCTRPSGRVRIETLTLHVAVAAVSAGCQGAKKGPLEKSIRGLAPEVVKRLSDRFSRNQPGSFSTSVRDRPKRSSAPTLTLSPC